MAPRKKGGTFKVDFHHRQNGRSNCPGQSSYACVNGVCPSFEKLSVLQTDQDSTGQDRWCQSEGHTTATISTNKASFSLRDSGCCWESNVNGKTNWTSHAELDLGTRSDSYSLNSCPVTTTVSSLRGPQNCFSRLRLLAHDPDGDGVRCRFTSDAAVHSNFTLDETACTLTSTGEADIGVHVFEMMLEDFPTKNITLTYIDGTSVHREASDTNSPPLCKVKLQFAIEILPPIPNCEAGHVQPMFLSTTPSHGDVLYATEGQKFQLHAQAQAHHASIHDFQVSGPQNMTKVFKDGKNGKAGVTLSWTPQQSDLYRFVPVCFTAETNETQSEMRCVVVMVTQASIIQGKATVECSPNKMMVALEKASMSGIDENYLKLRDSSCSLSSNATHIIGTMSFSTCGTKLEDKGDFIIFKNEINSYELPNEVIIRRKTVKIDFSCQFPKTISISSYYNLHQSDYIFTESSFGSFGYTFEIFRDSNYTNKVKADAYPVEVKLLETVFMGIQAQSELPNVNLFVESCKATPDDNPENTLSYDLIKNGCLQDETVKVHPSNQTSFNFEVQAFKFTGNFDLVYVTCSVILCETDSPFSRCAQGCLKEASRRRRRGLSRETVSHYITQGPLQFVGQAVPSAAVDDIDVGVKKSDTPAAVIPPPVSPDTKSSEGGLTFKHVFNANASTIVFGSAFLASLVMLAVVVGYFTRKRKAEDRKSLIVSEWEH
ncbi:scavenger receptor cysteine-rich domain-containing protein DMBT1-like [Enoplosus armatus]|uniref:scavenger receptor cysteine-rich domain-containing protein DMBT1-like n=1 Tax=Enoplosus armatus TaxID=215367 RepID=UPI003993FDB2